MRLIVIIHLCIVLSFACWVLLRPFTEEHWVRRSLEKQYTYVLSHPAYTTSPRLEKGRQELEGWQGRTFFQQMKMGAVDLLSNSSLFLQLWMVCSAILCFMLLFGRAHAYPGVWVLPLLFTLFVCQNAWYGKAKSSPDTHLYPSEQQLLQILGEPPAESVAEQKEQLMRGLDHFFAQKWGAGDVVRGEWAFHKARLEAWTKRPLSKQVRSISALDRYSSSLLYSLLGWTLFFAFVTNSRRGAIA